MMLKNIKKYTLGFSLIEVLIVIVLISILGSAGYLVWQNQSAVPTPTPTPTPSPNQPTLSISPTITPTPNPSIDWKTYHNTKFNYTFSYPPTWTVTELPILECPPNMGGCYTANKEIGNLVEVSSANLSSIFYIKIDNTLEYQETIGYSKFTFESISIDGTDLYLVLDANGSFDHIAQSYSTKDFSGELLYTTPNAWIYKGNKISIYREVINGVELINKPTVKEILKTLKFN